MLFTRGLSESGITCVAKPSTLFIQRLSRRISVNWVFFFPERNGKFLKSSASHAKHMKEAKIKQFSHKTQAQLTEHDTLEP